MPHSNVSDRTLHNIPESSTWEDGIGEISGLLETVRQWEEEAREKQLLELMSDEKYTYGGHLLCHAYPDD